MPWQLARLGRLHRSRLGCWRRRRGTQQLAPQEIADLPVGWEAVYEQQRGSYLFQCALAARKPIAPRPRCAIILLFSSTEAPRSEGGTGGGAVVHSGQSRLTRVVDCTNRKTIKRLRPAPRSTLQRPARGAATGIFSLLTSELDSAKVVALSWPRRVRCNTYA